MIHEEILPKYTGKRPEELFSEALAEWKAWSKEALNNWLANRDIGSAAIVWFCFNSGYLNLPEETISEIQALLKRTYPELMDI